VKPIVEPFAEFAKLQRGVPLLAMWRHRKTATIAWGDGTMLDHGQFDLMLDGDNAMRNELLATLKDCKLGRHACFSGRGSCGCAIYIPLAAGEEVVAVVRAHFTAALGKIAQARRVTSMQGRAEAVRSVADSGCS
jgi:hypothetical protein